MSKLKALYTNQVINVKETINSSELNNITSYDSSTDINSLLLEKIKRKIGNKCNENGFVDKNSIKIMSRSIGKINTSHFNGDIIYNVELNADICIPTEGNQIKCKVLGKNKIGILAIEEPIHIILASVHHENPNVFKDINKDDIISIEVINFKFKLNGDNIKVVGKFLHKHN